MKNNDVYDNQGQHGQWNKQAFERMPKMLQYFIDSTQKLIFEKVYRKVKELYGESGTSDLCKTSGFRSFKTNSDVGGVSDSLHLFGCAIDFAKKGIFKDNPIPTCCNLQLIDSGKCWHVQLKRGQD